MHAGFYIYMEASDLLEGQEVRLESETLGIPVCLSFSYYMYGKDVKELRLEQRNSMNNETKVVWTKKGEQGDYWNFQLQELKGEQYTVIIEAIENVFRVCITWYKCKPETKSRVCITVENSPQPLECYH